MGSATETSCLSPEMGSAIYFNDLTLVRDETRDVVLLSDFVKVWALLSEASGISLVRCDDETYVYIMRCIDNMGRGATASLLRKSIRRPFEYGEMPETSRDEFWGCEFHCIDGTGVLKECKALGWAISDESLAVGVCATEYWGRLSIPVRVACVDGSVRDADALCVTLPNHMSDGRVVLWCEWNKAPIPPRTSLPIGEKKITIHGDHHGNAIMQNFAERLLRSWYVLEVMSAEYQKSCSSPFINKVYADGRIRVCMYWEDIHYQLIVKTTACNAKQGEFVANSLAAMFDQGYRRR